MTIWRSIKQGFCLPTLLFGLLATTAVGLATVMLIGGTRVVQEVPSASSVEANIVTLETAQAQCTRIHGTLRVDLVNRHSSDRALVCDVSKDLSITLGTIRN